jgi:Fe-S cluster assembly ATP-binding protein
MLSVKNLHVSVEGKPILKGLNLDVGPNAIHAVMGPNGSGKSTLAHALAGRDGYEVTSGTISFGGKPLLDMAPEERAGEGLFLAFQYPVELPGVSNAIFLRESVNAVRRYRGQQEIDAFKFLALAREKMKELGISEDMLKRHVNTGFSGGEKKRNEVLQMALLEPSLAVLDETDSGLDVDALRVVSKNVATLRGDGQSILVITHYERLLEYIVPDVVHILVDGRIVRSGGRELAKEVEEKGYAEYLAQAA